MKTETLLHRHGGRIASIDAIEHVTIDERTSWHFLGTLEFDNGGHEHQVEIGPRDIVADSEDNIEFAGALRLLSAYLEAQGTWSSTGWVPRVSHGMQQIGDDAWTVSP